MINGLITHFVFAPNLQIYITWDNLGPPHYNALKMPAVIEISFVSILPGYKAQFLPWKKLINIFLSERVLLRNICGNFINL